MADTKLQSLAKMLQTAGPDGGPLFTKEHVEAMRMCVRWARDFSYAMVPAVDHARLAEEAADRLEALL